MSDDVTGAAWPDEIYSVLKELDVGHVCYVPDAGHKTLIERSIADNEITTVRLTTEEEGVAMLCGSWLGGVRGALLMQSSGAGNCMNMISLAQECRIPLLMLITMRGEYGEFNPWQATMGQGTQAALEAVGVLVQRADDPSEVAATVNAAARLAYMSYRAVAVLIGQRVIGYKTFNK